MTNTPKCYFTYKKSWWKGEAEYSNSCNYERPQLGDVIYLFLVIDLFSKEEGFGKFPQTVCSNLIYNANSTTNRITSNFVLKIIFKKWFCELEAFICKFSLGHFHLRENYSV